MRLSPTTSRKPVYANDTLVRIDGLQRQLADAIADGGDVTSIAKGRGNPGADRGLHVSARRFRGILGACLPILAEVMAELTEVTRT